MGYCFLKSMELQKTFKLCVIKMPLNVLDQKTFYDFYEALESVMCDVIKICLKRSDATRSKIKAPPKIW